MTRSGCGSSVHHPGVGVVAGGNAGGGGKKGDYEKLGPRGIHEKQAQAAAAAAEGEDDSIKLSPQVVILRSPHFWMDENMYVFNKHTIKVCVSCF